MSNTLATFLPLLIAEEARMYLNRKVGFLGKVLVEEGKISNLINGGNSVTIPTPPTVIATSARVPGTSDSADTKDLSFGNVVLDLDTHRSTRINFTELESRVAQGNAARFVKMAIEPIMDGIIREIDGAIAAKYSEATHQVGTYNGAITDLVLRAGLKKMAAVDCPMDDGQLHFATTSKGYFTDLLGIDRYVTPLNNANAGDVMTNGRMPRLFNTQVDFSNNVVTSTISSQTSGHSVLWHRNALVMAFMEFEPASKYGEPNVQEFFITHESGVRIRVVKWYDADKSSWFMRFDVKYGLKTLDARLMCEVLHTEA